MKKRTRDAYLRRRFGITEKDYDDLYNAQQGCCAVCGRHAEVFRNRLAVDHDHFTGEIRGLLCLNCNRYVVGRHRRSKGADLLKSAYDYLTREYPGWVVPPKKKKRKKRGKRTRRTR